MKEDDLLREIAETFIRFVHEHPEVPLVLHLRLGEYQLELRYRAAEVSPSKGAVRFGFRSSESAVTA